MWVTCLLLTILIIGDAYIDGKLTLFAMSLSSSLWIIMLLVQHAKIKKLEKNGKHTCCKQL